MSSLSSMMDPAGTEGARRATEVPAGSGRTSLPDPAVAEKASRRKFTTEYKLRILREAERCKASGEVGALLRREGLYSSSLSQWRKQRDRIAGVGLSARKRGPKRRAVDPHLKQLEHENAKLRRRLQRVEAMLEIQKKASELLGIPLNRLGDDESD
jgi:transposase